MVKPMSVPSGCQSTPPMTPYGSFGPGFSARATVSKSRRTLAPFSLVTYAIVLPSGERSKASTSAVSGVSRVTAFVARSMYPRRWNSEPRSQVT